MPAHPYGLGWACEPTGDAFGHGGACSTNLRIQPQSDLITIYLVQHSDPAGVDRDAMLNAFRTAATEAFAGNSRRYN